MLKILKAAFTKHLSDYNKQRIMAKMIRKRDMIAPGFFVPIKTLRLPKLPEGLTENIPS